MALVCWLARWRFVVDSDAARVALGLAGGAVGATQANPGGSTAAVTSHKSTGVVGHPRGQAHGVWGAAWWRAGSGELRRIFISAPMGPFASAGALGDGVFCVSLGSYFPKKRSRRGGRAAGGGRADP